MLLDSPAGTWKPASASFSFFVNWLKNLFRRHPPLHQPASPVQRNGDPTKGFSKEEFAALVLDRLRAAGKHEYTYDPDANRLSSTNRQGFLDNAYAEYCHAQAGRKEAILSNIVGMLSAQPDEADAPFDSVRGKLVTVVRERAYFSLSDLDLQIHNSARLPEPVWEPLTKWFARTLVVDAPSHMSLVNEKMRSAWARDSTELFAIGLEELKVGTEPRFSEDRGAFRGLWNDDYDSSRILVPGLFQSLGLNGDPVVTIPNRLTLLVAGSNDADALLRMLQEAEQIVQNVPRPQNPAPLVIRPDGIFDFHVDPTSPVFNAVQRAHRFAALIYYQEQQEKLERLYVKSKNSTFVAKYTLRMFQDGSYCSYATWSEDMATLLPVVDEVLFAPRSVPGSRPKSFTVPWERVVEVVPDLLLDANLFPQRFYVSKFPSDEQLARMLR